MARMARLTSKYWEGSCESNRHEQRNGMTNNAVIESKGTGIHWMPLIFIAILFIQPLLVLIDIIAKSEAFDFAPRSLIVMEIIVRMAIGIWASKVAVQMFQRRPGCLSKLKSLLTVSLLYVVLDFCIAMEATDDRTMGPSLIRYMIGLLICWAYFRRSQVVYRIYGTNL